MPVFNPQNTFTHILLNSLQEVPDQISVYLLDSRLPVTSIRYRNLLERSQAIAIALIHAGIQPGEVAIIILPHSPDLICAFFGAILAGAVPSIMPFLTEKLSPDQYRASLSALFEIARPAAIITYPEFVPEVTRARGDKPNPREIIVAESIPPSAEIDLTQLPGLRANPDDVVLLQHSSGTTGLQKGVALSHRSVFNQLNSYGRAINLSPDDVIVSWLPLYHDMGLIAGFLLPILQRIPLVLMSPFDWVRAPARLLQAISTYQGTLCWLPNFAYNFCAQKIRDRDLQGVDLSSLRAVINCSEPMYWSSHQMFLERFAPYGFRPQALATSYAMAENVFAVTQGGIASPVVVENIDQQAFFVNQRAELSLDGTSALKMVSAGQPISNTNIRVVDSSGRTLAERHVGEIAIHSDCMLTGYYNRPDLTEKAFLNGWYLTGDLGYLAKGELFITGRKKDLIIVGGKNIYPQDLERLASDVEGVHPGRVVAFGVFNEQAGTEEVVIVAEVDNVDTAARQVIGNNIRQHVTRSSDIALRQVHSVDCGWLLKTSSGKIARSANRDKFLTEVKPLG
jgi:acyl-CoA synthetase (AMP-forming)/AMP-acid ligase II